MKLKNAIKLKKEFLDKTIKTWQPYSSTQLTEEDAREIAENMTELFSFLAELEQKYGNEGKPSNQSINKKRRLE